MKSAILSIGTELLFGQITNTNTVFLSQQLNALGIDVLYHYTVGDNPARLKEMLQFARLDCDLIITTGGLGPTQDDLTKEIVCEMLHDTLILHQPSMEQLDAIFAQSNTVMTENNRKQAYMPSRATVFANHCGTAPGFALEEDGTTVLCLPGPPFEMKQMFRESVIPYLEQRTDCCIYSHMVRTFGIGESALETILLPLIDGQTDPTLATYASNGCCTLRITSKRTNRQEAIDAADAMLQKVEELVGSYIYSTVDEDLVRLVAEKLMARKLRISSAESCTGGLFAATLIDIPGISCVFDRAFVTYSNQAKMDQLGVKPETLQTYGAVSEETAREMAEGLYRATGSDFCISVTGIAGPDGGTPEKPVGTIYMGAVYQGKTYAEKLPLRNVNRTQNRNFAMLSMLDFVNRLIG